MGSGLDPDMMAVVRGEAPPLDGRTGKYVVAKADGSPVDPEAKYIILRIDGKAPDSPEREALARYIFVLEASGRHALAEHLRTFFGGGPHVE